MWKFTRVVGLVTGRTWADSLDVHDFLFVLFLLKLFSISKSKSHITMQIYVAEIDLQRYYILQYYDNIIAFCSMN